MIKKNWQKGTVVIITFLILVVLLLLGSYFLTFVLTETRISKSQEAGTQTYYLAEAGINEAIWKLKNDWEEDFVRCLNYSEANCGEETCQNWSANFSRTFPDGSKYNVSIQNSACGRGQIISTAALLLPGGKTTQRVIKTIVFKALGSPTGDSAIFSGGSSENVDIKYSRLRIYDGNLFSNHILKIKGGSTIEVYDNPLTEDDPETEEIIENLEGQVLVVDNLIGSEQITAYETLCAKDICTEKCALAGSSCPPASKSTPLVDFESPSPSYSFKSRAQTAEDLGQCQIIGYDINSTQVVNDNRCIYSASEFEDFLSDVGEGGTLTLNPNNLRNIIFYIESGNLELKQGCHLIINGVLVVYDNLYIGKKGLGGQITINQPDESPSGLLVRRKIEFGSLSAFQTINITGVVYSYEAVDMISIPETFNILGGMVARKLSLTSLWQWLNITLDDDIILYGLGYLIDGEAVTPDPEFSPIITVDHWEESY